MRWVAWLYLVVCPAFPALAINFDDEIIPVLTKAGCNAGACHGAAAGRGGFHLSLLGADPAADFEAIVQAFEGRRINRARPELSLVLAKPTGQLDHGGDVVLDEDGFGAQRLLEWIRAGAPRGTTRRLANLDIIPSRHVSSALPDRVPLRATAHFEGGSQEDVSAWTVFTSTDTVAVDIDEDQVATIKRGGQHTIIARFLERVVSVQINVPLSNSAVDLTSELRANFIDQEILNVLSEMRIPVSRPATDAEWLRRVSLDLTGRLPDPVAVDQFLGSDDASKRDRMVERLLSSDAFVDYWTLRFGRLLRLHSLPNDKDGVRVYAEWLRKSIQDDVGLDQMARQLLVSTGDSHLVGPANFARMVGDPREQAELVGQFFLGARLGCANCHNHPLDKWTQDDYHGLAAVFASLERGRHVQFTARGAVTNLRTNEPAIPRIPAERYMFESGDHREELVAWLTAGQNLYFARATVNRLWQAMFGRGLVDPTDDLRETNPPTHPELLERLAQDFAAHGYRIRHTLQRIALSTTYARSDAIVAGNALDDRFYSRAYHRPLMPEILADAIADVTGVADEFDGHAVGVRAVTLVDPLSSAPALDILGRCSRSSGCDESGSVGGGLPIQLHLMNGDLINRKLTDRRGRLVRWIESGHTDSQIVSRFYQLAIGRLPTVDELQRWSDRLADNQHDERRRKLEDFVWSLLNSRQFMENH